MKIEISKKEIEEVVKNTIAENTRIDIDEEHAKALVEQVIKEKVDKWLETFGKKYIIECIENTVTKNVNTFDYFTETRRIAKEMVSEKLEKEMKRQLNMTLNSTQ